MKNDFKIALFIVMILGVVLLALKHYEEKFSLQEELFETNAY